jgi:hypothetical protein
MNADDVLKHFGILGMKWGVRRDRAKLRKLARQRGDAREWDKSSDDYKKAQKISRKQINQMSNAELREFTQRLQLEKQYKSLTTKEISAGRKIASDILVNQGKIMASAAVAAAATHGVKKAIMFYKKIKEVG